MNQHTTAMKMWVRGERWSNEKKSSSIERLPDIGPMKSRKKRDCNHTTKFVTLAH